MMPPEYPTRPGEQLWLGLGIATWGFGLLGVFWKIGFLKLAAIALLAFAAISWVGCQTGLIGY